MKHSRIVDAVLAVAAIGGLGVSVLLDLPLRSTPDRATDLKTLYASAWCLTHGLNAYAFSNLEPVFRLQGVVPPVTWFGHAPVYPPSSLALIAPFSWMSMTAAAYCLTVLSMVALAVAVWSLLRYATETFQSSIGWKVALVCLCAAGPLLSFALGVGNLSVLAAALAIIAFTHRDAGYIWTNGCVLAVAVVLKPHLAIWFVIGMFLLRVGSGRRVAIRAAGIAAAFTVAVAAFMGWSGSLGLQWHAFFSRIDLETLSGASMNSSAHEALPIAAQITSMQALVGFWTSNAVVVAAVSSIVLAATGYVLVKETRAVYREREASMAVSAWMAFGMLATYHRAHDAIALLLFVPYALDRLRCNPKAWRVWAMAALYGILSIGPGADTIVERLSTVSMYSVRAFVLLRQGGLADLCFLAFAVLTLRGVRIRAASRLAVRWNGREYESSQRGLRPIGHTTRATYSRASMGAVPQGDEAGTH